MALKNLGLLGLKKPLKTPEVQNLGFLGFFIFWSNFIPILLNFTF